MIEEVTDLVPIRRALISVTNKTGLDVLVPALLSYQQDLHILSSGGTYKRIQAIAEAQGLDLNLQEVADYTGYPESPDGLLKTLHPKIHGGLLLNPLNPDHWHYMQAYGIEPIDLVVVNLYPFQDTVTREGVTLEEARENIDIGGPTMIRAGAKNFLRVAVLTDPAIYEQFLGVLAEYDGCSPLDYRMFLASEAFEHTNLYDRAISEFLGGQEPDLAIKSYLGGTDGRIS